MYKKYNVMEAHRPRHNSRRNSDKELVTNTALIMGAMQMLRDRTISPTFREQIHTLAKEAIGKLALLANEDGRLSALKEQLSAVMEQADHADKIPQAAPAEPDEQSERRKAA